MTTSSIPAPRPVCPNCHSEYVKRVSRAGLSERFVSLFHIYPFCCQLCGYRFKLRQPGVTYTRIEEDRREYYRWSVDFPITFRAGTKGVAGLLIDISMGGCAFHTEALMLEGIILQLDLQLPQEATPVKIDAAVVRSVRPGLASVEFLRIEHSERERLKVFVRSLMRARMNSNEAEDRRLVA
jgi:PilZ domain